MTNGVATIIISVDVDFNFVSAKYIFVFDLISFDRVIKPYHSPLVLARYVMIVKEVTPLFKLKYPQIFKQYYFISIQNEHLQTYRNSVASRHIKRKETKQVAVISGIFVQFSLLLTHMV